MKKKKKWRRSAKKRSAYFSTAEEGRGGSSCSTDCAAPFPCQDRIHKCLRGRDFYDLRGQVDDTFHCPNARRGEEEEEEEETGSWKWDGRNGANTVWKNVNSWLTASQALCVNRTIIRWTWRCNLVSKLSSLGIRERSSFTRNTIIIRSFVRYRPLMEILVNERTVSRN